MSMTSEDMLVSFCKGRKESCSTEKYHLFYMLTIFLDSNFTCIFLLKTAIYQQLLVILPQFKSSKMYF